MPGATFDLVQSRLFWWVRRGHLRSAPDGSPPPVPSPPAPAPRSVQPREGVRAPATGQPASRPLGLTRGAPMVSMSCLLIVNLSQVRVGFVRSTSRRSSHVSPHRTWLCTVQVRKRRFGLEPRNVCRKHIKLCKKGQRVREKGGVSDLSPGSRAQEDTWRNRVCRKPKLLRTPSSTPRPAA